jgi:hypothetical protein
MKTLRLVVPGLLLAALTASGCWLTSGQFTVSVELPDPLTVAGPGNLVSAAIDLNNENAYNDHKSDLKGIVDYAILGTFINNSSTPISLEVWMTPGLTSYTTETELNADATRVRVWGPLSLGASATVKIDWDDSAALFSSAGKTALLDEVLGDGAFTLYAKGTGSSYNFTLDNGVAVVVIDAGK